MKKLRFAAITLLALFLCAWTHGVASTFAITNRLVEMWVTGDSISANGIHYDLNSATPTNQQNLEGYLPWMSSALGWNYTAPKSFAVGGTGLAAELGYVTAPCTGCDNYGDVTFGVGLAMNAITPVPDLVIQQGGINDCTSGLSSMETGTTNMVAALLGLSAGTHVLDLQLLPYHGCDQTTLRGPLNAWKAANLPTSRVATVNNDAAVQDAVIVGALDPQWAKEAGTTGNPVCDNAGNGNCLHLNAPGGILVAQSIISQMASNNSLPAPTLVPFALDATTDTGGTSGLINYMRYAGSASTASPSDAQTMKCTTGCTTGCTTVSGNMTGTSPLKWTISSSASFGVTSSVQGLGTNTCLTRITYNAVSNPGFSTTVTVQSSVTPNALVAGNWYRSGIHVKVPASAHISGMKIVWRYIDDGVTSLRTFGAGSDNLYDETGSFNGYILTPEWKATNCTSSCTVQSTITLQARTGTTPTGNVEFSLPFTRRYNSTDNLASWP